MASKKQDLLTKTYNEFYDIVLYNAGLERLAAIVAEDVMGYGTTIDEKIVDLKGLQELIIQQSIQGKDIKMDFDITPVYRQTTSNGDLAIYVDEVKINMQLSDGVNEFSVRISTILEFKNGIWKVIHWHGSKPVEIEGDTWHKEEWKQKNEALQKLVDEKTAELVKQNRELEIEASLERVRTVAMSMRKSSDMLDVCRIISDQLQMLEVKDIRNVQTAIINEQNGTYLNYQYFTAYSKSVVEETEYNKNPLVNKMVNELKSSADAYFTGYLTGEELEVFREYRKLDNQFPDPLLDEATNAQYNFYSIGLGGLGLTTYKPLPEAGLEIFKRYHNVFKLAYRRFIDIQQAEAQAREAQIEAALERVRSRSMAMYKSDELRDTAMLLFQQVEALGVAVFGCGFNIWDDDRKAATAWMAGKDRLQPPFKTSSSEDIFLRIYEAAQRGDSLFVEEQAGDELDTHYKYMASIPIFNEIMVEMAKTGLSVPTFQIMHCAYFSHGYLMFISFHPVPYAHDIFRRFAKVFEQTYIRFLDLKKAEAQAREAQIELALERIRAQAMAMKESSDLLDIVVNMRSEFIALGHEAHYFWHMRWLPEKYEKAMTSGDGARIGMIMTLPRHIHGDIELIDEWEKGEKASLIFPMDVETAVNYVDKMITLGDFEQVDPHAPTLDDIRHIGGLTFIMARTTHGEIGYSLPGNVPDPPMDGLETLTRFAGAFDLAYKRFEDLKESEAHAAQAKEDLIKLQLEKKRAEEALNELQHTQKQLIHAEKMASLGELTAGIAHEIQNPLNFVNNFSEVSVDLVTEMNEEMEDGNTDEVKVISNDLKQNLEKINHHGKRASFIIKGMLEHSRTSTGEKTLTDINVLAEEFLKLSYHGLRAKDKSFNAEMKTDFDQDLNLVKVVAQDIGRVILNLINNAFHAVAERAKQSGGDYKPLVTVATSEEDDQLIVKVGDNGNGIPEGIREKIFQPFFTTKPTGQGTGLGLSLSYDIIKAHGGTISIESKENSGSEFIILLPIKI